MCKNRILHYFLFCFKKILKVAKLAPGSDFALGQLRDIESTKNFIIATEHTWTQYGHLALGLLQVSSHRFSKVFAPYPSYYNSSYSTRRSQSGGNFLVIRLFTNLSNSSDYFSASPSLASFRK